MNLLDKLNLGWTWGSRLPIQLQTEAAECGLACLAMVSGYYGYSSDLTELRRRLAVSLKGVNLNDLISMANRLGFASRPVRLELDELERLKTPCILHWDLNHFVVLDQVSGDHAIVHDPASGVRRLPFAVVSRHFTGIALELTPVGGFAPVNPAPRLSMRSLIGRMVGLKRQLAQLFLLALAIEMFSILSPLFLQWVVDHALVTADRDLLTTLALAFGLLLLLKVIVSAMRGWMLIAIGASMKVQARSNLFSHLLGLPASYFEARHLGDVMSRFGSQDSILQAITTDVVEAVLDGLFTIVTLWIMFLFAPGLTTLVLMGALAYGLLRWFLYVPLRQASLEAIVWSARRDSHFLETLRGIKTIKLFNDQEGRRVHWLNLLIESVNRQLITQNLRLIFRLANTLLIGALAILIVWLGAGRVLASEMSIGMLLAFITYKDQFLSRISNLIDRGVDLWMLRLHADRLADIALSSPEPAEYSLPVEAPQPPVQVELRDVRFRYGDNEPWVLDGVSLRVEAGEAVAIVGPSGCGKTTLLKILASLLSPTQGEILVDGQPLTQIGLRRWRSMIGVVMQDDRLFSGSIADNICFFAACPDLVRIEQCARLASIHDTVVAMPMGYNTLIGDMGTVLSGGQKQRLLIARAMYRQPGMLLMDEATSHLDADNEELVSAAIRSTKVTRIIVAHRAETIRSMDRVIHLEPLRGRTLSVEKRREARLPPAAAAGPVEVSQPQLELPRWQAWNEFLHAAGDDAGFMQTSWYADFRASVGYECFGIVIKDGEVIVGGAMVMKLSYSSDECFYYICDGPVLTGDEATAKETFQIILESIDKHRRCEAQTVSHLRIEPRWRSVPEFVRGFTTLTCPDPYTEPRSTLWIDLRASEEAILAQMKPKGRYNIRVAQRHGVTVVEDTSERGLADFLRVYKRTVGRHQIDAKEPDYFRTLLAILSDRRQGSIYFAEHRGKRLAAALVVYFGGRATYLFGGSLVMNRQVMAGYLLHFEIMRRAKERGCEWYDLWGVAPQDQPDHPWRDISVFKRKYGGVEVALVPTLDHVYDRAAYGRYLVTLNPPGSTTEDKQNRSSDDRCLV
ncbi:peptidoglycan bridge formation glycyltransferase FemA/FemB family protein [Steroidobacter flavus]|uniref:Peptidoglycan bridge formation glycyltransferase FemA/FemB family protein n=1 Tax=Steroidobacter flavus TaxID=1842136 RepID=A0ABV8T1A9_9GAMM